MNHVPLISIITVVFNGEKYLEQTIKSVLGQTYTNIEYIIVDGGSTDSTLAIVRQYEDQLARWISEPDKGLYDAMNKGIRMATGDIIGMINSDDWYEPNAVQLIVDAYRKNPTKKIFHADRMDVLLDGSRRVKRFNGSKFKFLYYGMTYNHPSMFVHRDVYKDQSYNTNLRALSDYEFVLKNLIRDPEIFLYLPNSYVNYRLDGLSGTMSTKKILREGFEARKNAGLGSVQNYFSWLIRWSVRTAISVKKTLFT